MALCLANSLIARKGFNCYDQLVRYRWWQIHGYMSATGKCFDIGSATRTSLDEFSRRQKIFADEYQIPFEDMDYLSDEDLLHKFDVFCSEDGVAGNGALMRLAPLPLFFYQNPQQAVQFAGTSGKITHGDQKAVDACRYYSALIVAALQGETKEQILDQDFYQNHINWFHEESLHEEILKISQGSYKKEGGYDDGIRGKGYIVNALEAALWAFWADQNSFQKGVLAAINLGDDTDTTAAIYGQLAGAFYGYRNLPSNWIEQLYAKKFIETLSKWIQYEGQITKTDHPSQLPVLHDKQSIEEQKFPSIKPELVQPTKSDNIQKDVSPQKTSTNHITHHSDQNITSTDSDNKNIQHHRTEQFKDNPEIRAVPFIDRTSNIVQQFTRTSSSSTEDKNEQHSCPKTPDQDNSRNTFFTSVTSSRTSNSDPYPRQTSEKLFESPSRSSNQMREYESTLQLESPRSYPREYSSSTDKQSSPTSQRIQTRTQQTYQETNSTRPFSYQSTSKRKSDRIEKTSNCIDISSFSAWNINKKILLWTIHDVGQWLESLGGDYSRYVSIFKKDFVDGFRLVNFINNGVLIEYGITNENHRQTILNAVQLLRNDLLNAPPYGYRYTGIAKKKFYQ